MEARRVNLSLGSLTKLSNDGETSTSKHSGNQHDGDIHAFISSSRRRGLIGTTLTFAFILIAPQAALAQTENTAYGTDALSSNTTGDYCSAFGDYALDDNTTGTGNTAMGRRALFRNESGGYNTAIGFDALKYSETAWNNTAIGAVALQWLTTGWDNIAIGSFAGYDITTGSNNIAIGNNGTGADNNTVRIGNSDHAKTYIAGISGKTASGGVQVYINSSGQLGTLTSSERFKEDICPIDAVSDKLMQLRPVSYRYKEAGEDGSRPLQYGLLAEEVAKVYPELVQYDKDGKPFTVYYHLLTPLLLSELQQAHATSVSQQVSLTVQEEELAEVQALAAHQQEKVGMLQAELSQQQKQQSADTAALHQRLNELSELLKANAECSVSSASTALATDFN